MAAIESTGRTARRTLGHKLTEPAAAVTDPAERRTARLLASVLLVIGPLGVVSIVGQAIDAGAVERPHLVGGAAVSVILFAYFTSRTVYYAWAAVITTLVPSVAGLAFLAADRTDPGWFAFMALSPALGSLLVPARRATMLAAVNLVAVVAGVVFATELDGTTVNVAVMFNLIMTAVLLTARRHRDQLEQDRRAELLARQRLNERILEGSFGGIALHRGGELVQVNETFGAMFGLDTGEAIGRELSGFFEIQSRAALAGLTDSSAGGSADLVAIRPDGSSFDVEVLAPPGSADGEARVLAVRDISDRKRAADALVRAQRMESVGRVAAGIAHDTNNLLAVILLQSERLAAERVRAGLSNDAEESIHTAAQQIATLLGRLQLVDRGRIDEPVTVDLRSFVADRQPMWRQIVDDRIDLEVRPGEEVGQVMVDPTNLEQVLLNLILNARDAMPSGGHLAVTLDGVRLGSDRPPWAGDLPPGDYQRVTVTDNGQGIPPENLDRIFEPFFTTKEHEVGTGIGLYTSREVIEAAGGALVVAVQPDSTNFYVLLPEAP